MAVSHLEPPDLRVQNSSGLIVVGLYAGTGFVAAILLFVVEPLAAKSLLPVLGGSPSVWNTAMAFFQVTLLAGYLAAHLIATRVPGRWQRPIQLLVVAVPLLLLPFGLPDAPPFGASPVWWELAALATMIGAPFLALATVSPTVQKWFAATDHPRAADPFFLYAASNLGSFLGLLAYPLLIEPRLDLVDQSHWFGWGYALFVVLMLAVALTRRRPNATTELVAPGPAITNRRRLYWAGAAAIPSLLLLGVTRHLATDVASFPLLWVIPLALYLATFIVAFGKFSKSATRQASRLLPVVAIAAAVGWTGVSTSLWIGITLPLTLLVLAGTAAHGSLYRDRPGPDRLTEFYLWVSAGGALGGLFGALAAPVVFNGIYEYPIAIVGAVALTTLTGRFPTPIRRAGLVAYFGSLVVVATSPGFETTVLVLGIAGVGALVASGSGRGLALMLAGMFIASSILGQEGLLVQRRTFFGVYRVVAADDRHSLVSGTTVHGAQGFSPQPQPPPLTYYHQDGPFGDVMRMFGADAGNVGLVGLGAGALAFYGQPGQVFTFYEIDPAVVEIARDPSLFTYLQDTKAEVEVLVGDGRLRLVESHPPFQLLVVDAFSSDSIPTHLLTVQAIRLFFGQVEDGSIVALHISNRHLDLEPIVGRLAAELGLSARVRHYSPAPDIEGASPTSVVILAEDAADLGPLAADPRWPSPRIGDQLWTDTYTDLISVIRWG
ncbi:MAG TPA: hypothetical protein VFT54_06360 [Acidimicrobiia bacterium]|nr:hypothetical protein [Acidimicrobiia bacterium]